MKYAPERFGVVMNTGRKFFACVFRLHETHHGNTETTYTLENYYGPYRDSDSAYAKLEVIMKVYDIKIEDIARNPVLTRTVFWAMGFTLRLSEWSSPADLRDKIDAAVNSMKEDHARKI